MKRFQLNLVLLVLTVIGICFFSSCMKDARTIPGADITSKAHTDSTGCIYKDTCKLNGTAGARILANRELVSHGYDATGRVEIAIWREVFEGQHVTGQVSVDPGYVLVGGGADITNLNGGHTGVNALLTAEYPVNDGSFSTFAAASKDHEQPYYHKLWVYATGMRLLDASGNPLSDSYVKSFMYLNQVYGPSYQYPSARAYCPGGYRILSGGAKINWSGAGNLLVVSKPWSDKDGWEAQGKDHRFVSPASIDAYVLSINPDIPGFGRLVTALKTKVTRENSHSTEITDNAPDGYVVAGVGAAAGYGDQGRMLYAVYPPSVTQAYAASKDHVVNDLYAYITLAYIAMRKE
jgi:hypothetical protein